MAFGYLTVLNNLIKWFPRKKGLATGLAASGLNYGSNFVTYASDVSSFWGIGKLDIIYPLISLAYGIAGFIGPVIGGLIRDSTGSYNVAIILGVIICSTGIFVYSSIMPNGQRGKSSLPVNTPSQFAPSNKAG